MSDFVIIMPPPNITGILHIGHVVNMTLQDVLIRRAINNGINAILIPGLDHAAISTENKVINSLKEKGIRKSDLSRDEFLKYCWEWKEKYGGIIVDQIKKLNCLCNWEKLHFTLDDDVSKLVVDVFIKMYNDGFIYKAEKMVNWDSENKTAISDEEVIYRETIGTLFYLKYKFVDNDGYLVVATSRPETIFGDVAICVNPNDQRYKNFIGKKVVIPIVNREIPILADEYVDKDFGSGCLKVTPAHDFNDYKLGEKYKLKKINILNQDGTLNGNCGEFNGIDRFAARKNIKIKLEQNCLIEKIEQYKTRIAYSERSNTIIEPRLSKQWFIKMKELCIPALEVVLNGNIKFYPDKFINIYKSWIENIQDWCISRQLYWGHRIPVYYYKNKQCVARSLQDAQKIFNCDISEIKQDEDVLDTWFSSALWPIVVTKGLSSPTEVLVTGPDIIFFWVARMIIMSLYLKKIIPFKNVYFTGIVRDNKGRKMSKSLGNSPDPLDLIQKYGVDGLRFGLLLNTQAGNDIIFEEKLCKQGRNFITKIKNAYRLLNIWEEQVGKINLTEIKKNYKDKKCINSDTIDELLLEVDDVKKKINEKFEEYKINEVAMIIYKFFWDRFCSIYLEKVKPKENKNIDKITVGMFYVVFFDLMKILNPFIPETTLFCKRKTENIF